ncbi:hypothetical protein EVAR_30589_1 [Eumeta japonica]|uniref:Uncharacterized protein n=1 Tax=Eumeta variegata TaxID=151549 RepID=A0A4C1W8W9_EUMVA|nr:hypothetical protein EVAR_30589_1 [Eumeta japonica]
MSILKVVRNAEVADLAVKFRRAEHGVNCLKIILENHEDASENFFDIATIRPNPLLVLAISYEPPPSHHFCRRPRNILSDPHDDLTVELEKFLEVNRMGTHRAVTLQRHLHAGLDASDEGVKAVGLRDSSYKLFRSSIPTVTCEANTAMNKSQHRSAVHYFVHTLQESVLRGDCEENPKYGLTRRY